MDLSMPQETNETLPHNNCEVFGHDNTSKSTSNEQQEQLHEETNVNGSAAEHRRNEATQDPHTLTASKHGTSPPTEHKQHMHLPLRKRHLLASSTGSHHNENSSDNNHTITPQASLPTTTQDGETVPPANINNITLDPHASTTTTSTITKLSDSTTTKLTDPPDPPEPPENTLRVAPHTEHKTKLELLHDNDSNIQTGNHSLPFTQAQSSIPKRTQYQPNQHQHQSNQHQSNQHQPNQHQSNQHQSNQHQSNQHQSNQHQSNQHQPNQHQSNQHQYSSQHLQHSVLQHSSPLSHSQQHPSSQPKVSSHVHNSPTRAHSPTGTHSPTRAASPSSFSYPHSNVARHSASRGRGGRGRSKSSKEGLSTATTNTSNGGDEELYCFCRRPYDPTVDVFMICCDSCDEWYHGSCVGVNQREAKKIARYVCPRCKKMPTSPTTASATSSEVSSEGEPGTPPTSTKNKKRKSETTFKNEASFKTEPKRQALSPTLSDNGVDTTANIEETRFCLNCNKQALPKSKYCGPECGLEYARKQYHHVGKKQSSAAEVADKEALDEIARRKADIVEKLNKLAQEQRDLEKAIQFAKTMDGAAGLHAQSASPTTTTDAEELAKSVAPANAENTTIDCISCGHPIAVGKYTLHMERCFHKKENNVLMVGPTPDGGAVYCNAYDNKTKTFCKKVKTACALHAVKRHGGDVPLGHGTSTTGLHNGNGVDTNARRPSPQTCGCPTSDFQSGYCELSRKTCVKHHNWEELMRDSISNQRTQHNKILVGLEGEEQAVRQRMARRSQSAVYPYRTIEEA